MADRTLENKRITVHYDTEVEDAYGGEVLEGLKLHNTRTGGCDGVGGRLGERRGRRAGRAGGRCSRG